MNGTLTFNGMNNPLDNPGLRAVWSSQSVVHKGSKDISSVRLATE